MEHSYGGLGHRYIQNLTSFIWTLHLETVIVANVCVAELRTFKRDCYRICGKALANSQYPTEAELICL